MKDFTAMQDILLQILSVKHEIGKSKQTTVLLWADPRLARLLQYSSVYITTWSP